MNTSQKAKRRRIFRWVITVIGVLILLAAIGMVTPLGIWVLRAATPAVSSLTGWTVKIEGSRGVLAFGPTLEGVQAISPDGSIHVNVGMASVHYWPFAATIQQPSVRVVLSENASETPTEQKTIGRLPLPYLPRSLDLEDGSVEVVSPEPGSSIRLSGLSVSYRTADDGSMGVRIHAGNTQVAQADTVLIGGPLHGTLQLRPEEVLLDSLMLSLEEGLVRGSLRTRAWMRTTGEEPIDAYVEARIDTSEAGADGWIGADVSGHLLGPALDIELSGGAQIPGLTADSLVASAALRDEVLSLATLEIRCLDGLISAEGEYDLASSRARGAFALRDLDLAGVGGTGRIRAEGEVHAALADSPAVASVTLSAELTGLELVPGHPLTFAATGRYEEGGALDLRIDGDGTELGVQGQAALDGQYTLSLMGRLEPEVLTPVQVTGPFHLSGAAAPESLNVTVQAAQLRYSGYDLGGARLDARLRAGGPVTWNLALGERTVRSSGRLDLQAGHLDTLIVEVTDLPLAALAEGMTGYVSGSASGSGPLEGDGLKVESRWNTQVAYQGWAADTLYATATYRAGRADVRVEGERLEGTVQADVDGTIQATVHCLGELLRKQGTSSGLLLARGRLDLRGRTSGLGHLVGEVNLDTLAFQKGPWRIATSVPLLARMSGGVIHVTQAKLRGTTGEITLSGTVSEESLDLTADLHGVRLTDLLPRIEGDLEGRIRVSGAPGVPLVRARLETSDIVLDSLRAGRATVQADLDLSASRRKDALKVEITLSQGEDAPEATVAFTAPVHPLLEATIDTAHRSDRLTLNAEIRSLDLSPFLTYMAVAPLQGALTGTIQTAIPLALGADPFDWRGVDGLVELHALQIHSGAFRLRMRPAARIALSPEGLSFSDVNAEIFGRPGSGAPAGRVSIAGLLSPSAASDLTVLISGVDLEQLGIMEGSVQGFANVTGDRAHLRLHAGLHARTERLGDVIAQVAGTSRDVRLRGGWITTLSDTLKVAGELPWDPLGGKVGWEKASATIRSDDLRLDPLLDLLPALDELSGRAKVDAIVRGAPNMLDLDGGIHLTDLSVALRDLEPVFSFPRGDLFLRGRQVQLVGLEGHAGSGRLNVEGEIWLDPLENPSFQLFVTGDRVPLEVPGGFGATVTPEIVWAGAGDGSEIVGEVQINKGLAAPELSLGTLMAPVPPMPPIVPNPFLEHLGLDVQVDIRDFRVETGLAELALEGGVHLGGTFHGPALQGDIDQAPSEEDPGKMYYLDRAFEVDRAKVEFNRAFPSQSLFQLMYKPMLLDPELDVAATAHVIASDDTEYEVALGLVGQLSRPEILLSSAPYLDIVDIVQLLTLGSPGQAGDASGLLVSRAAELSGRYLMGVGGRRLTRSIGLDEFQIRPSGDRLESVRPSAFFSTSSLYLGKRFSPRFRVRYEALLEEISLGTVRADYRLTSDVTLRGFGRSRYGQYGLGIGFRKDF